MRKSASQLGVFAARFSSWLNKCALNLSRQAKTIHASSTRHLDGWLLFSALMLLCLGWLMVSSASVAVAENLNLNTQHYAWRQGFFAILACGLALVISQIPIRFFQALDFKFLLFAFVLLALVLVIGKEINGSKRWISLVFFNLQTSEIAKICLVLYIASYLMRHLDEVRTTLRGFVKPLIIVVLYGTLLIMQPDYGSLVVAMAAVMGMVYLAGVKFRLFVLVLSIALVTLAFIAILEPYRVQRLTTFTDPWSHQFNTGYQLTQALIAFGRGQWLGLGLGNSVQKLLYLPEAHTDFIFSILAEELGLIGALLNMGLFVLLISRIFVIGRKCELNQQAFSAYFCYGFALIFATQFLINLGVNMGVLPTKGLTLPLISYGGSSLLASGLMLGLVIRADLESRQLNLKKEENS